MATKRTAKSTTETLVASVSAIKGFDKNLQCRTMQFEVGKTYTHDGAVKARSSGFHAITAHPLAVFDHYPPAGSRFCMVELSGAMHSDDQTKTAAAILTVGREIGVNDLVNKAIKWVLERSHPEGEHATGTRGASSATGTRGAALSIGLEGKVSGTLGNALFSIERAPNGDVLSVACGIVGKKGLKPNVFYWAQGGKLVEVA